MKLLAVADIHGKRSNLTAIEEGIANHQPDALVIAGDISRYGHPAFLPGWLEARRLPIITVRGNTDPKRFDKERRESINLLPLHLEKAVLKGIPFVGISGAIPIPFRTRVRFRQKEDFLALRAMLDRETILVVHPPPLGTLDKVMNRFHAGCGPLRDVIRERQPRMVICGHIHENTGKAILGRTTVVNCAMGHGKKGALIDLRYSEQIEVRFL